MAKGRVLVVGATGYVGSRIVRRLVAEGRPVRALVRPPSDPAALAGVEVETVHGDLKDPASLARACEGADVVVTTANSAARSGADTVQSVDLDGNRALVDAAEAAGVDRFVFLSAKNVAPDHPIPFARAKALTEVRLRASAMHHTILRGDIFRDSWWTMIVGAPIAQGQPVTFLGNEENRHTFVDADDVAAVAVAALGRPYALDRTLDVAGPEALSWLDVVRLYEKVLGREVPVRRLSREDDLPGYPKLISDMFKGIPMSTTDMTRTAKELGVRLTPAEATVRALLQR